MEKALKWWYSLSKEQKIKLAEDEHWTTPEIISDEQIMMIYDYKFNNY